MKKKFLIPYIIISGVALIAMAITIVFAWYTNMTKVGKIDAETEGLAVEYTLNDGDKNVTSYTVTNLTFFDVDATNELEYFLKSACLVEIDLKNVGSNSVDYTLEFKPTKEIVKDSTDETKIKSTAYVDCILTTTALTSIPSTVTTVQELKNSYTTETETANKVAGSLDTSTGSTAKVYMYLYGVQEIDSAVNDDFIYNSFLFSITLSATQVATTPDVSEGDLF